MFFEWPKAIYTWGSRTSYTVQNASQDLLFEDSCRLMNSELLSISSGLPVLGIPCKMD